MPGCSVSVATSRRTGFARASRHALNRRDVDFARTVVKSPGIAFSGQAIDRAVSRGRLVIDELELGWRLTRTPVLAVTGTNGKSTVSGLARAVLQAAGNRVELAGNTEFGDPLSTTAMRPLDWIVCETSSYQLEGCVSVLPELAVFTNLTLEHLGRHRTLERYGRVKRRLFIDGERCVQRAVIDIDTAFGAQLAADVERLGGTVSRVGSACAADYRVIRATWDLRGSDTTIGTPSGELTIRSCLPGVYNARNLAAGLALADLLGIARSISVPALCGYPGTPGRFQPIDEDQPYDVIVDFAHTPDAMEQFLVTVRAGMARSRPLDRRLRPGKPPRYRDGTDGWRQRCALGPPHPHDLRVPGQPADPGPREHPRRGAARDRRDR